VIDKEAIVLAIKWEALATKLEVSAGILSGESKGRVRGEMSTLRRCARELRALAKATGDAA
jgi:hypothetical protein